MTESVTSAAEYAAAQVAAVRDDPVARFALLRSLYEAAPGRPELHLPYRDLSYYIADEHGVGRMLDLGLIRPRLDALYSWSATELSIPRLTDLLRDGVPAYAWDVADASPWDPAPMRLVRAARRVIPARRIGS